MKGLAKAEKQRGERRDFKASETTEEQKGRSGRISDMGEMEG